jgi:recombinational DNA repair ATPase RecF
VQHRARLRLATTHALDEAVHVAEWVWRAAGTDAIVTGSAFDRRFRDLHTVSQQIQARIANFQMVGQILLGQEPAGTVY